GGAGVPFSGRGPAAPGALEDEAEAPRAAGVPRAVEAPWAAGVPQPEGAPREADPAQGDRPRIRVGPSGPEDGQAVLERGGLEPLAGGESLAQKLGRRFVVSVELDPPRGPVARKFLQGAAALGEAGVDAINVADSPMARVRMSAIVGAH